MTRVRCSSTFAIAILCFLIGSITSVPLFQPASVRADNNRVFQLMVYHAKPGKAADLESVFRDVSKLQAKHGLDAVGYWVPIDDSPAWKDTFVYLVAHPSREEARKNWDSLHADLAFPPYRKAAAPLIEQSNGSYRVEEIFMRPSGYSAMK